MPDEIPQLDAIGLACPLPVLRARKRLAAMRPGERLAVLASDPMAAIDIPHLCHQDGHVLLERSDSEVNGLRILRFVVERGPNRVA
ncbi:sulfurtransferase TusA family protein [Mesorhizobium sp. BR1-1-16]|uniref:sulfurtransferase TusA family protein n=1 Tax=Mesorhizobium sp. BR1-1-16 TaxID=2876653 RepID=UPI001CC96403|nr:sulfurtransferase TusA family protein [Mesorhizobium sp. BR1-1-16]